MKTVVIVQARSGSTRLPRKVMLDLAGATLLERMLERVLAAHLPTCVVLATTIDRSDDAIREIGERMGLSVFSGHTTDLLDRHYQAARAFGADAVVKVPSDCPLIDPAVVDGVIARFHEGDCDYASNLHPASWPDGQDVEAMSMAALEAAWREARRPLEREHTTPFLWERPERFRIANVRWSRGVDYSMTHRWTIDYPEDYHFIRSVYDRLWNAARPVFSIDDVLALLEREPALGQINAHLAGVNWYRLHLNELRTIDPSATRNPVSPSIRSEQ